MFRSRVGWRHPAHQASSGAFLKARDSTTLCPARQRDTGDPRGNFLLIMAATLWPAGLPVTANVDPQEIAKFAASASRWWDLDGEFKPLHQLNPVRLRYVEQCAGGLFAKRVADIGCGGGLLAEALARRGAKVTAIDLAAESLDVARNHAAAEGLTIDYRLQSAEALAEAEPGQFEVVTCMEMLEHVPDPAAIVRACATLLKPGGTLVLSTLNRSVAGLLLGVFAAEYLLKLVPKGTHDWQRFLKPSELLAMGDSAGLLPRELTGIDYNPLTGQVALTPGKVVVNYLAHLEKP